LLQHLRTLWFRWGIIQLLKKDCNGDIVGVVKVKCENVLKTFADLDYTLFTVKNFDSIKKFGYYDL